MTYLPTPEQFLAEPSTEEDDFEEVTIDPLASMAESLASIAKTLGIPVAARDAEAADAHAAELRELGQAYDDLEDKHRALYEVLADVEKIVAKSTSKVSLEVKAAINRWRNPEVPVVEPDPEAARCSVCAEAFPDVIALQAHGTRAHGADFDYRDAAEHPAEVSPSGDPQQPDADASLDVWRAYARSRGVEGVESMNRSQIRTALGLSHFDSTPA